MRIVDSLKCMHSLKGEVFGPVQQTHVSTFDIEVVFSAPEVDENGILVDFDVAQKSLANTLAPMRFQNLDHVESLQGINTTTENLCRFFHDAIASAVRPTFRGSLRITLHEGQTASASYDAPV